MAGLTPERLGAGTTIHFGFTVSPPPGALPVPISQIELLYPAHLGIATSGLGISTCEAAMLVAQGPSGCPTNSVIGYGTSLVEVPFGPELLKETSRTILFMAPVQNERLGLLFYAEGEHPVAAELVFPGTIITAPDPFGGALFASLPLVPTLPDAPDAAVVNLQTTLGPSHITYFEYRRGRRIPYRPAGILLPDTCPRGGFRFAARFTFVDESHTSSSASVPCPRRARSRRRSARSH